MFRPFTPLSLRFGQQLYATLFSICGFPKMFPKTDEHLPSIIPFVCLRVVSNTRFPLGFVMFSKSIPKHLFDVNAFFANTRLFPMLNLLNFAIIYLFY